MFSNAFTDDADDVIRVHCDINLVSPYMRCCIAGRVQDTHLVVSLRYVVTDFVGHVYLLLTNAQFAVSQHV